MKRKCNQCETEFDFKKFNLEKRIFRRKGFIDDQIIGKKKGKVRIFFGDSEFPQKNVRYSWNVYDITFLGVKCPICEDFIEIREMDRKYIESKSKTEWIDDFSSE